MVYRELEEVEKEVVLLNSSPDKSVPITSDAPAEDTPASSAQRVIKSIKKPAVEVLCSQHNPVCWNSLPSPARMLTLFLALG